MLSKLMDMLYQLMLPLAKPCRQRCRSAEKDWALFLLQSRPLGGQQVLYRVTGVGGELNELDARHAVTATPRDFCADAHRILIGKKKLDVQLVALWLDGQGQTQATGAEIGCREIVLLGSQLDDNTH